MLHAHDPDLRAWLALSAPGIGRRRAMALLQRFGGPSAVFDASDDEWAEGLDAHHRTSLRQAWRLADQWLDPLARWLERSPAHAVVSLGDPHYPPALLHSPDPPLLLHTAGSLSVLKGMGVAVVGSRHGTPLGLATARMLAQAVSDRGIPVVSGLALGIDAAAHEGGLIGAGGTVAVIGSALDEVYPKRHQHLAQRIMENGVVVSEYLLGTPALKEHFPQRNRIIAGLSRAIIVVEAASRSGSLITARLAGEAGREVFAVPGPITSPLSAGCHALIKQGAALLDGVEDLWQVWDAYGQTAGCSPAPERRTSRSINVAGLGSATARPGRPGTRSAPRPTDTPASDHNTALAVMSTLPSDSSADGLAAAPIGPCAASAACTPPSGFTSSSTHGPADRQVVGAGQREKSGGPIAPRTGVKPRFDGLRKALTGGPVALDELVRLEPFTLSEWQTLLMEAEMMGFITRLAGGRYQWTG